MGVTYQPQVVDLLDSHTQAESDPKNPKCMIITVHPPVPGLDGRNPGASSGVGRALLPPSLLCRVGNFVQRWNMGSTLGHCLISLPSCFPVLIRQQNES